MIEEGARTALSNLSSATAYAPARPTTITIELDTVDKAGQFRGRSGVEVVEPLKVVSQAPNWLAAWDQIWPFADVWRDG
jgi:hypothetical protein